MLVTATGRLAVHRRRPSRRVLARALALGALVALGASAVAPCAARAQAIDWETDFTFYLDNTEFFTPYRVGQTIFGAQFQSYARVLTSEHTQVVAGVFGDHRYGDTHFLSPVLPIIGFRYLTESSLGALGTLVTEDRHGYLEPMEVTTLEFTRPIEYGGQWRERRKHVQAEFFLNWQHLNDSTSREIFDYGLIASVEPVAHVALIGQLHGLHHGGQLFDDNVPTSNNVAACLGIRFNADIPLLGASSLSALAFGSHGNIDPNAPPDRPTRGKGVYIRPSIAPFGGVELFGIWWRGKDYLSDEGDNNYNSVGHDPTFYMSDRKYLELGAIKKATLRGGLTVDGEFRLHRIDDLQSIALFDSKWEYSYRFVVKVPVVLHLKRASGS